MRGSTIHTFVSPLPWCHRNVSKSCFANFRCLESHAPLIRSQVDLVDLQRPGHVCHHDNLCFTAVNTNVLQPVQRHVMNGPNLIYKYDNWWFIPNYHSLLDITFIGEFINILWTFQSVSALRNNLEGCTCAQYQVLCLLLKYFIIYKDKIPLHGGVLARLNGLVNVATRELYLPHPKKQKIVTGISIILLSTTVRDVSLAYVAMVEFIANWMLFYIDKSSQ